MRIVSLVPSITELLVDLGLAGSLVGRTGFCIHPREVVREIPKVGGTKDVKVDRIRELAPTHVVVNVDENRLETVEEIAIFTPSVIVTHPLAPIDNLELYRLLGAIFGREAEAAGALPPLRGGARGPRPARRPGRRALPDLARPVDDRLPRHLHLPHAGADRLADGSGREQPTAIRSSSPPSWRARVERVLLSSEPFRFRDRHIPELEALVPGREGDADRRRDDVLVRQPGDRRDGLPPRSRPAGVSAATSAAAARRRRAAPPRRSCTSSSAARARARRTPRRGRAAAGRACRASAAP